LNIKPNIYIYFCLTFVTLALYWKTGTFGFINYDDPSYVYANNNVTTGLTAQNIRWAMTASEMGNWNPLTWLSHMLDCELFGINPKGHHLTNTLLHAVNTLLLCYMLNLATGRLFASAFVAALFSLHPLHVESIAWVAERKDLLSGLFFMLTLVAYNFYVKKPGIIRYLFVVSAFALGLAAKPMLVTLPVILLALDYWPLSRLTSRGKHGNHNSSRLSYILLEKIPLVLLSVCVSVITLNIQKDHGALLYVDSYPLVSRLSNAAVSYATYIIKVFWPAKLAMFYPIGNDLPGWHIAGSLILLICITTFVILKAKRYPFLPVGWFWYLLMLLPVIGILQVGLQSRADRYTYLPLIGFFIMITWGANELLNKWQWNYKKHLAVFAAISILSGLAIITSRQLDHWQDGISLYTHTLSVTRNNFTVHFNLASTLAEKGRIDEAIFHYLEAIRTAPDFFEEAHMSVAFEYYGQGKYREAMHHYAEVLRMNPENSMARERMKITMRFLMGINVPTR